MGDLMPNAPTALDQVGYDQLRQARIVTACDEHPINLLFMYLRSRYVTSFDAEVKKQLTGYA